MSCSGRKHSFSVSALEPTADELDEEETETRSTGATKAVLAVRASAIAVNAVS
jgi:hypothetical protein